MYGNENIGIFAKDDKQQMTIIENKNDEFKMNE